jgi:hypothetical protein
MTRPTCVALLVVLLGSILVGVAHPSKVAAQTIPDPRFGVIEAHEAPQAATALGAGWTRIRFEWNSIQPNAPGEWQLPVSDQTLSNELASGREVVGLLVTTPGWATDFEVGPGVPRGLYLPTDDPNNLWAGFVRRIVSQYAGRIDRWTIWNEPDIPASSPDMSWGGPMEDFVRLLQVAYTVAKQVNPNAVIHMAAITHHHDEHWFGRFLNHLVAQPGAAGNGYYFDVATLHLYHEPEKIHDITAHYRDMMRGHGMRQPIWIAETNAYLSRATPEEQAFFIVQALSLEVAAGAQRVAVYKMVDTETDSAADPEPFGLVRMDGSRRPAFTAYRVATTYLAGFRGGSWDRRDDVSVVTIDRGAQTTSVVWSRIPGAQTAMIPARTTRALLVDVWGSARYVYAERGYFFVDLPGADCNQGCWLGGAPYMLVEEAPMSANTAPTPRSPTPPPTATPRATNTPAIQAAETPTAALEAAPTRAPTPTPTVTPSATVTPSRTSTATPSRTNTPTATATPSATATPNPTSTPRPSPAHTPLPADTPAPSPTSTPPTGGARTRSWVVIGFLVVGLGGVAVAAGISRT